MRTVSETCGTTLNINFQIIAVPEEEEKEKGHEKIFEEVIVEKFPNLGKEIATQFQEVQRVPYRINLRRTTPRHIVIKLTKIKFKEKILKAAREKQQITNKGNPHKVTSRSFSRNSAGQKGVAR